MKIAILTIPFQNNYGGIIQNYALQKVLENLGHEVYTINLKFTKRQMSLHQRIISNMKELKRIHINRFIHSNIKLTEKYYVNDDLSTTLTKYNFNAYIVGSDQVWREPYARPNIQTYFFDFLKDTNVKRIGFSVSFETDKNEYSNEQIKICGNLFRLFNLVTTREDSGIELINNIYKWQCHTNPVQTIDPSMLLSKEDYMKLSLKYSKVKSKEKTFFYYVLDMNEEKQRIINKIEKELDLKAYTVIGKKHNFLHDNPMNYLVPPIERWIQAFANADFVFTDSFHGTVFSIIFNKKFITYGNKERGLSRFTSLLKVFNLNDRMIYSENDLSNELIYKSIDWTLINSTLENEKNKSIDLLNKALLH